MRFDRLFSLGRGLAISVREGFYDLVSKTKPYQDILSQLNTTRKQEKELYDTLDERTEKIREELDRQHVVGMRKSMTNIGLLVDAYKIERDEAQRQLTHTQAHLASARKQVAEAHELAYASLLQDHESSLGLDRINGAHFDGKFNLRYGTPNFSDTFGISSEEITSGEYYTMPQAKRDALSKIVSYGRSLAEGKSSDSLTIELRNSDGSTSSYDVKWRFAKNDSGVLRGFVKLTELKESLFERSVQAVRSRLPDGGLSKFLLKDYPVIG